MAFKTIKNKVMKVKENIMMITMFVSYISECYKTLNDIPLPMLA